MIEVKNLVFTYKGAKQPAVNNIEFKVADGEIFGFLGPSGAGKSTTQKILIGLLSGYNGSAKVMGKEIGDWGKEYYEKIGVSFELPNHFLKLTAEENLEYFSKLYSGRKVDTKRLLEVVGLEDDADKKVADFSKGMQMRLNYARSLLNDPQLIFLDEPTSGMDPVNAKKVKDSIKEQKEKGKTVFLTTHNMSVADELCDRVAFIVDGKIVLIDSPKKLKIEQGERVVKVSYYPLNKDANKSNPSIEEFSLTDLGRNQKFLDVIKDTEIETIHTKESTLEDIFIRVTGRNL